MYENRIVAFIDILGFGALVEESSENVDVAQKIRKRLVVTGSCLMPINALVI